MGKLGLKKYGLIILIFIMLNPFIFTSVNGQSDSRNLKIAAPATINLSQLPEINYTALNAAWNDQKIEMLIIVNDSSFVDAVTPLMEWKNEKGVKTIILSNYSDYKGRDKTEKIRNMIKDYYEKENIMWVLLAGDAEENLIPIREVYNPDVVLYGDSEYPGFDAYYKPTDFYYADLTGSWDDNNNSIWGESAEYNGEIDEISWIPEVYVGRLPASNPSELSDMINKTLKYETDPYVGDWMNKMLLAGGVSSGLPPPDDPDDDEDEARLTEYIWENYVIDEMNFTHLTKTTESFNPSIPAPPNRLESLTSTSFRNEFNSGYSTVIIAGHAEPTYISDDSGEIYYRTTHALSSNNTNMPSLFYADACTTSSYDKGNNSIGESLITRADSGAIGYIGAIRVTWYYDDDEFLEKLNRGNAKLFWEEFFIGKKFQQGRALYDSKVAYINSDYYKGGIAHPEAERKNLLTYCLLGDPEVDIYTNKPKMAMNPFAENYYEGQLVSITIKDISNKKVPYGRVHLTGSDGKYYTAYADVNGSADFRLPIGANENYSVIITGHNLIPSYFNFTTLPDTDFPELLAVDHLPINPTVRNRIFFTFSATDNHSGIESVFLVISKNNFSDFSFYRVQNDFNENNQEFSITLNKLDPGEYSYLVITRDYTNKTSIFYEDNFKFLIPNPPIDYVLIIVSIMVVGLVGISIAVAIVGVKRHKKSVRNLA